MTLPRTRKCYILVGLPGCGKTTWRKDIIEKSTKPINVVSFDDYVSRLRKPDETYEETVQRCLELIITHMITDCLVWRDSPHDVIIDLTNLHKLQRELFKGIFKHFDHIVVDLTNYKDLVEAEQRLKSREPTQFKDIGIFRKMVKWYEDPRYD